MLLAIPKTALPAFADEEQTRSSAELGPEPPVRSVPPNRLPPLTWGAQRLLLALALLCLAAVSFNLNGSSSTLWRVGFGEDLRVKDTEMGLIAGVRATSGRRMVRLDPAFLSQARQPQPFPVYNPSLGPGTTPLLMSLPARHYTMAFRPALWGFFVMPFDYAFSLYWNLKVFCLFAAMFLLFWTLTEGRLGLSIFGAVAVEFSGFVQWWFSTPAMLPEMLTCWAAAILATLTLFMARSWRWQAASVAVFVYSATQFALCCYPAFMIALLHLGICLTAGYLWQKRLFSWRGAYWLLGAMALTGLVLAPWVRDCLPTLRIESETVYPGHRHTYGGTMLWYQYLSGLFTLAMTEGNRPFGLNVCELSNFYPLWLLPLGLGSWSFVRHAWRQDVDLNAWLADRGMKVALAGYIGIMALYCLLGLPHWFCDATLLSRETERRSLIGSGMAGMLLLLLALASRPARGWRPEARTWLILGAWLVGVSALLSWYAPSCPEFFLPWTVAGIVAAAVASGLAYFFGPRFLLPTLWSVACVTKLALVNPVCVGLPELLESPAMNRLHAMAKANPAAQWAVYDTVPGVELIKTTGAHVVNGARIIPDFELINRLDPEHKNLEKYNQYSHLQFTDAPYAKEVDVTLYSMVFCLVRIGPQRLHEIFPEVKYLISSHPIRTCEAADFHLVGSVVDNRLFVYQYQPK